MKGEEIQSVNREEEKKNKWSRRKRGGIQYVSGRVRISTVFEKLNKKLKIAFSNPYDHYYKPV